MILILLKDECSFVSLRDVERTLKVFGWMYNQTEIFHAMDEVEEQSDDEDLVEPAASVNILEFWCTSYEWYLKMLLKTL